MAVISRLPAWRVFRQAPCLPVLLIVVSSVVFPASGVGATVRGGDSPETVTRGRNFGDMIGLQVKFSQGQPMTALDMLPELGVRWVRDGVHWPVIEPAPGEYREFPSEFLQRLDYYRQHRIGVVFLLAYGNPQAYPATATQPYRPLDPKAFGRYALQVARMLRQHKVRFVLEIWNEPHNFEIRKQLGGAWNGLPPSPWVDHYVKMAGEAVRQVKSLDPGITLLTNDDMWVLHYRFLDAGLPRDLDGFAVHPYTRAVPEVAAVDAYTKWVRPYTVVDSDRSFGSAVKHLRAYGAARLDAAPQLWITEWGWPIGDDAGKGEVSEEQLAAYLPRAFIMAAAAGIRVMCWFSAQDTVDGPMGLTDNQGRRRKSFYAFKTMSENLADYELDRQWAWGERPTSGAQAFLFRGRDDYRLVVWNVDDDWSAVELPGLRDRLRVENVFGQPVSPETTPDGRFRVRFAAAPIYLSGLQSADLSRMQLGEVD